MVVKKKSRKSNLTAVQIKKFLVRNAGRYSIRMLATTETRYPAYIKKGVRAKKHHGTYMSIAGEVPPPSVQNSYSHKKWS